MRLISVSYGHDKPEGTKGGSGKLYDYETDKQYRAGDVVVVPVTNWRSKKTYNTLATVQRTLDAESAAGEYVKDYLEGNRDKRGRFKRQIEIKDVGLRLDVARAQGLSVDNARMVNITTLPGYSTRASDKNWTGKAGPSAETNAVNYITRYDNSGRLISRTDNRGG